MASSDERYKVSFVDGEFSRVVDTSAQHFAQYSDRGFTLGNLSAKDAKDVEDLVKKFKTAQATALSDLIKSMHGLVEQKRKAQ